MKDYDSITAELEGDWNWRFSELKKLANVYNTTDESNKIIIRKSQILLLYSHFEGYSKFVFLYYILTINEHKLKIRELNATLKAASMHDIFKEYENTNKKGSYFRKELPDNNKLRLYSRRCEFVDSFYDFLENIAEIPETIVDTESNLKPEVLYKILFQLGFSIDEFKPYRDIIQKLLNYRNNIAHGNPADNIDKFPYESILNSITILIEAIKKLIRNALYDSLYLHSSN